MIASGSTKQCRHFGKVWQLLEKIKHILNMTQQFHSDVFTTKTGDICPHSSLQMNVYRSFIQSLKTWNQPSVPLLGEQTSTPWCLHSRDRSPRERDKLLTHTQKH